MALMNNISVWWHVFGAAFIIIMLFGYPVAFTGLVSMPRGLGSFIAMFAVGQLMGRMNIKLLLTIGLSISALSLWQMSHYNLQMDTTLLVTSGFLVDQYFISANRLVEARLGKPATPPQTWRFNGNFVQYEELTSSHKSAFNFRYLNLYEQPNTDTRQGGYGHIEDFRQGVPVSGLYDLGVTASARNWGDERLVLNSTDIRRFADGFVPEGVARRSPEVSPLYADLAGLPPALFSVGTRDPLLDDTLFMSMRWAAANNGGYTSVYTGGCHVFIRYPLAMTQRALELIERFLMALA